MQAAIHTLLPLFERERSAGRACVLAVVLETAGSTYSKAGALLLVAASGEYSGLISGGCLEGDLREHALTVLDSGRARRVAYDLRGPDDALFGLGAGCEGAMQLLLLPMGPANGWQPMAHLAAARAAHRPAGFVLEPGKGDVPPADGGLRLDDGRDDGARVAANASGDAGPAVVRVLLALPPRILLLGGGPDALPMLQLAAPLGWQFTVSDHRAAYADRARFPTAERVLCCRPAQLAATLPLDVFAAALVMSHHLDSDAQYLQLLAGTAIPYVGLLGPAPRRERLRAMVGERFGALAGRLRSPVGLALGGRGSEAIALAIVAEIHAFLHGAGGGPYSESAGQVGAGP
jgi:xanthine/CO dehydrogenase XdhC/CoxF family maturation factor